jgi:hypothetical protein
MTTLQMTTQLGVRICYAEASIEMRRCRLCATVEELKDIGLDTFVTCLKRLGYRNDGYWKLMDFLRN